MTYSDDELEAISQWENEGLEDYLAFSNDASLTDFRYVSFVSNSKGRKRGKRIRRKIIQTVELFTRSNGKGRWTTKPPFDDWAQETYGRFDDCDGGYLSDRLQQEIIRRSEYR